MTHPDSLASTGTAIVWHCGDTKDHAQADPNSPHHHIQLVINVLLDQGYKTSAFEHKHQIADNVIKQQPDLLFICLQTAGNEGYNLCQKLRQYSATCHLPIIFLGSRSVPSQRLKVLRCGGTAYLQLPMSSEECWLSVKQQVDTARLVRQLQSDSVRLSHKVNEYSQVLDQQTRLKLSLAQENQALQKLAFVDGLTQVANRRSFNQTIARRWQAAYENQQPLSLLLCDIDYFKRYNDTYGHVVGDRCLRAVADALVRGTHRDQDQVARYGGEEFAIILPDTESSGAQRVALSVQSEIARAQIPHDGSLIKDHISLSLGIFTLVPQSARQPCEMLVHGADEALYAAKLGGRDRTVTNTVDGFSSPSENYCLYDYTQADDGFSGAALSDGMLSEATLSGAPLSDGVLSDGLLSDGLLSDGALSDDALSKSMAACSESLLVNTDDKPQFLKHLSAPKSARIQNQSELDTEVVPLPSLATFLVTPADPHPSAALKTTTKNYGQTKPRLH